MNTRSCWAAQTSSPTEEKADESAGVAPPLWSRRPSVKRFALECAVPQACAWRTWAYNVNPDDSVLSETPEEGDRGCWPKWPAPWLQSGAVNGLQVYVMCELPQAMDQRAEAFAERFLTAFSIGLQRPPQSHLGLIAIQLWWPRSPSTKRHPIVRTWIRMAIRNSPRRCGRKNRHLRPGPEATIPSFARFLVEQGIDSIS